VRNIITNNNTPNGEKGKAIMRDFSLDEVIADNYIGIGELYGRDIIVNAWSDYLSGRVEFADLDVTEAEYVRGLIRLTTDIVEGGYLNAYRTAGEWLLNTPNTPQVREVRGAIGRRPNNN
jgi:hypothetical protein